MTWTRSNPLYPVSDVAASLKRYADVCGCQATLVHEGLHGPNYAVLYRETVSIHLVRAAEAQHGITPPVQAQFWVDEGFEGDLREREATGRAHPGTHRGTAVGTPGFSPR